MIKLDSIDPDWKKAELHGKASRPGKVQGEKILENVQICPCCLNQIQKQQLHFCESSKKLQFMGVGFPLFYNFLKHCILLITVFICSYSAMSLYWSILHNQNLCDNSNQQSTVSETNDHITVCYSFMVYFARIQHSLDDSEIVLRIISFVMHMLVLLYIKNKNRQLQQYFYERTNLISDYSIVIKGLPKITGIKSIVESFLTNQFGHQFVTHHFTYAPITDQLTHLQTQQKKLIEKRNNQLRKIQNQQLQDNYSQKLQHIYHQLESKSEQIYELCKKIQAQMSADIIITQKVIVSLGTEQQKKEVLTKFKQIAQQALEMYFGKGCSIKISGAPQPREIIWENYNISHSSRIIRIVIGWILSIFFIAVVTVVFYFVLGIKSQLLVQYLQHYDLDPQQFQVEREKAIFIVYFTLVFIIIFNKFFMSNVLHFLSHFEKHQTKSKQQFAFAIKYSFGMFFTTALMTLAVQAFRFKNYLTHEFGVIQQESIMFFLTAFFVPFIWLVNPLYIIKRIKRKLNYGKASLTQREANELMEDPYYDLGKRYAQILQMLWFTFLYATVVPFGSFLTWFGLILYYIVDKYNLIARSSIHGNVSGQLNQIGMFLLDLTLLFNPAGEILFDQDLRQTNDAFSIVLFITAIIFLLIPWNSIFIKIFSKQQKIIKKTYQECKPKFYLTYHTYSPTYQQLYIKKLFKDKRKSMMPFDRGLLFTEQKIIAQDIDDS